MTPVRTAVHLVTRFLGVLRSKPLGPEAQAEVSDWLHDAAAALFWEQDSIDQRHAYEVAQRVRTSTNHNQAAVTAALLHDVGKRHSNAGPLGRSLATILDSLHLPLPADWRRYRDHEALGAADLQRLGADSLAIAFARGRREEAESIDADIWQALVDADNA